MAETLIDYLLQREENNIQIASILIEEAQLLSFKKPRCWPIYLDLQDSKKLDDLVKQAHIVIPYVPSQYIITIAKSCLRVGRHMVTAQYLFDELKVMDSEVKKKDLIFLNEIGLDPGLDHLATIRIRDMVQSKGGKIIEYESWCGGLPAPEFVDNPFGYKFSWSPIAAIKNINNDAQFIDGGQIKKIQAEDLLYSSLKIRVNSALILEGYANRDSVPYKELYELQDCQKLIRGTLRYDGFSIIMSALRSIGLCSTDPIPDYIQNSSSYFIYLEYLLSQEDHTQHNLSKEFYIQLAQKAHTSRTVQEVSNILIKVSNRIFAHHYYNNKNTNEMQNDFILVFQAMDYLRFFDPAQQIKTKTSHIENLAVTMFEKMQFLPGQTDFVVMQHIFKVQYPDEQTLRTIKSTLIMSGEKNGRTAMAQTVSIPTGIAVQCILDGTISVRGVHMPNRKDINDPIIEELEKYGLMCVETEE